MLATKQKALRSINALPVDADLDEIMVQLFILDKTRKSQQAIEEY